MTLIYLEDSDELKIFQTLSQTNDKRKEIQSRDTNAYLCTLERERTSKRLDTI